MLLISTRNTFCYRLLSADYMWLAVITYGHMWLHVVTCGYMYYVWLCLVTGCSLARAEEQ